MPHRVISRFVPFLSLISVILILPPAVACSLGADDTDELHDAEELAIVWEAWQVLADNYADPAALDEGAVAGGAIERILKLGDLEPYPFLADLGRMRGQVPSSVPAGLVDVWRATQIYRYANSDMDSDELSALLIRGLLDGLPDAGAGYLTAEQLPEAQEQLKRSTEGSYLGIGARVESREGRILLVPFEDSPAHKAGVEPGDVLLAVDGVPVGDSTPSEVGARIKGEEGTKVRLSLQRIDEAEPLELDVFRGNVELPTISRRLRKGALVTFEFMNFETTPGNRCLMLLRNLSNTTCLLSSWT